MTLICIRMKGFLQTLKARVHRHCSRSAQTYSKSANIKRKLLRQQQDYKNSYKGGIHTENIMDHERDTP